LRRGKKYLDNDGLYAAFKFLIDGFRHAGLIANDDPTIIREMGHAQEIGDPVIGIRFELALPAASESCQEFRMF